MTTEIIVYRNPAEAALWNMLSNGEIFPFAVGIVVFFVVFLAMHRVLGADKWHATPWRTYTSLGIAAGVAIGIIYSMLSKIM